MGYYDRLKQTPQAGPALEVIVATTAMTGLVEPRMPDDPEGTAWLAFCVCGANVACVFSPEEAEMMYTQLACPHCIKNHERFKSLPETAGFYTWKKQVPVVDPRDPNRRKYKFINI
jgi:hypothetical protein